MSQTSPPPRRGAASVEMALCMLLIIPLFAYTLFLDDLLRYSLDAQEAAVSTVWDYTVQDYTQSGDPWPVQHYARLMFCDHESGKQRYDEKSKVMEDGKQVEMFSDCADADHHRAVVAHQCWINDNAEQVTCTLDESVGRFATDGLANQYHGKVNKGGLYKCRAKLVVENYLLPKSFLPEFSKDDSGEEVELTKERWVGKGDAIHENAKHGTQANAYYIKEQHLAILADTWALRTPAEVSPGEKNPSNTLYSWVDHLYTQNSSFTSMKQGADDFFKALESAKVVDDDFLPERKGDDPRKPNLSIHAQGTGSEPTETIREGGGGTRSYFNTEWRDWDRDRTRETYNKRGGYYLGCTQPEAC